LLSDGVFLIIPDQVDAVASILFFQLSLVMLADAERILKSTLDGFYAI
jgi:hypothetical protein